MLPSKFWVNLYFHQVIDFFRLHGFQVKFWESSNAVESEWWFMLLLLLVNFIVLKFVVIYWIIFIRMFFLDFPISSEKLHWCWSVLIFFCLFLTFHKRANWSMRWFCLKVNFYLREGGWFSFISRIVDYVDYWFRIEICIKFIWCCLRFPSVSFSNSIVKVKLLSWLVRLLITGLFLIFRVRAKLKINHEIVICFVLLFTTI